MKLLTSLFAGVLFGLGMAISGMVDPARVIDIGASNRRAWILAPGTAWIAGCDVPATWSADVSED